MRWLPKASAFADAFTASSSLAFADLRLSWSAMTFFCSSASACFFAASALSQTALVLGHEIKCHSVAAVCIGAEDFFLAERGIASAA